MAKSKSFNVDGFEELLKNLQSIEKVTKQREVMRKTLDDASKHVLTDAQNRAAKHGKDMSASFIQSGRLTKAQAALEKAEGKSKTAVTRYIGSNHHAAVMTEYGTDPHVLGGMFAGAQHPGTAPSPMMRPAWENGKEEVLDNLAETLGRHIAKAIKNQERRKARSK